MRPVTLIVSIAIVAIAGAGLYSANTRDVSYDVAEVKPPTPVETVTDTHPGHSLVRTGTHKNDFAALNAMRQDVITLPSGVQYEVLEVGSGDVPTTSDSVLVRYQASLPDGRVFDTTEVDQEPLVLPLDTIAVPGLREALLMMPEGAHWRVVIPPSEGFGRSGNNRLRRHDLIYDIRLVAIEPPA